MAQVVSFEDYVPVARYDAVPWTLARIEEAVASEGPWVQIDELPLDPIDSDPANPIERNLSTDDASDAPGLWYRLIWVDGSGALSPTQPVQNDIFETLSTTALCTDEDVRQYLGIKDGEISDDDRATIVRLVNAASETFTDESQRLWKVDPALAGPRLYRLDSFDVQVGRLRIDDATTLNGVGYGTWRDPLGPSPINGDSYYAWQDEPGYPISAIVFVEALTIAPGNVISVDADWGWPAVPEKVRQAVIYTAAEWYARDVEKFSATFSLDQARILLPQVLPRQVQATAESYRRWRVA